MNDSLPDLPVSRWSEIFEAATSPSEFWSRALAAVREILPATRAALYLQETTGEAGPRWRLLARSPQSEALGLNEAEVAALCQTALTEGRARHRERFSAVALQTIPGQPAAVIVSCATEAPGDPDTWRSPLTLLTPLPRLLQLHLRCAQSEQSVRQIGAALDLMLLLNRETRFLAAAMRVCNELASRHNYLRVAIGWLENDEIHLKAINHSEQFERKMELARTLEEAMEEALDQDIEVVWPDDGDCPIVTREHAEYAKLAGAGTLLSIPLRKGSEVCGILCCERQAAAAVPAAELAQLRLYADQIGRRLDDLHRHDRWWGGRLWLSLRESLATWLGPRHTGWKLTGCGCALLLLSLLFIHKTYQVEASFTLKSEADIHVTAPYEGFLMAAPARIGDSVTVGTLLATFDDRELRLQETDTLAELGRYQREAEKARAENDFGAMRIAGARAEQLTAKLEMIRQRLTQTRILSPQPGVIVEGDLRERIGAPFDKGESLFRLTDLTALEIEAEIDERDIDELSPGAQVVLTFASRPQLRFHASLTHIHPSAIAKEKRNVFRVRCHMQEAPPEWWRPGMGGVARIAGPRRSLFWIFTHRTIDYCRMHLWW